jgi:hypothetical protein
MAEYIDRAEYCEKYCRCSNEYCDRQSCPIWKAPTADVAPVVHGRWIYEAETLFTLSGYCCSVCRRPRWLSPDVPEAFKYCPNCGAKMQEVE